MTGRHAPMGDISAELARREAESVLGTIGTENVHGLKLTNVIIVTETSFPYIQFTFSSKDGRTHRWQWLIPQKEEDLSQWRTYLYGCLMEDIDTGVFPPAHSRPVISRY